MIIKQLSATATTGISLKDNTDLSLEHNAILLFAPDKTPYLTNVNLQKNQE